MSNCENYVSEEDILALKESEQHIEHVARSRDSAGNKVLSVTDTIRGESVSNRTLDGLEKLYTDKIGSLGYQQLGDYAVGLNVTSRDQIVFYDGSWYMYRGDLPHVTSGTTLPDDGGIWSDTNPNGLWVNIGINELYELLNTIGGICSIPDFDFPQLNDSDSIQASLNTGKPVVLIGRQYIIDKRINLQNSSIIRGCGKTKTTLKCTTSDAGLYSGYGFNIQLSGFRLDGGNTAEYGITLGSQSGISAHHIVDNVQVYDCNVANIHVVKGIYHHFTDSVYATGGAGYGLLTESMDVSIVKGRYYNHTKGSVVITNSSNFNNFKGKVYNDISFPSDYLMIVDSSCGNNIGFDFEPQGENNVKASLIIDNITGIPWKKSNMSDNFISGNFLGLSKTSLESHIIVGGVGAAYKTVIDHCKFLTLQNGLPDVKLVRQNNTKVINCINNLTYDTPILKDPVILNVGGDPYIFERFSNTKSGQFVPQLRTTGTQPTVTTYGNSVAYYELVGNICHVDLWINATLSATGTGAVEVTGLPFKQLISPQRRNSISVSSRSVLNSGGYVAEGEDYLILTNGTGALVSTDLQSSFNLRASFSYKVS